MDDIAFFHNSQELMDQVYTNLASKYQFSSRGKLEWYIGLHIRHAPDGVHVSQTAYIENILKRFGMNTLPYSHVDTPTLVGNLKRINASMAPSTDEEREIAEKYPYAEALGALQWLVGASRPDVGYAVNRSCRYLADPGEKHWAAVVRILLYLRNTKDETLFFPRRPGGGLIIEAYTDADYATCPDTRRSQSGAVIKINGSTVYARSALQRIVTLSPMETEYVAAVECAQQVIHVRRIVEEDLGFTQTAERTDTNLLRQ